jgi:hypothetical protein
MNEWIPPTVKTIELKELENLADLSVAFTTQCVNCTCDKTP